MTKTCSADAVGTVYIRADGSIDPSDAPISTVDNVTYTLTGNIPADADGIVVERSNITIDGNGYTLQGTGVYGSKGIYFTEINNVTIKNTTIRAFYYGTYLSSTSYCNIYGNQMALENSIYLYNSSYNRILSNELKWGEEGGSSFDYCIFLEKSFNNTISGNKITNSYHGIGLGRTADLDVTGPSYNNTISQNEIAANQIGIRLGSSGHNIISENNIRNNQYGIFLFGYMFDQGSENSFYHNNFTNYVQVFGLASYPNVWDGGYPSGGNYWSDYNGTDLFGGQYQNETGSDGIGDMLYVINENNADHYPLIQPWPVSAPPVPPALHDVQAGVKAGDWIKIDYIIVGWPAGTSYPLWLKVEFLSVEGTAATVRVTMHMSDGTEQNATVPVDVVAGGQAFGLSGFVIPANLTTGDVVYMSVTERRDLHVPYRYVAYSR